MSISLKKLMKVRCRLIDRRTGQPVPGIVVSLSVSVDGATRAIPISTLSSDATGYLSFDLKPLVDLGIDDVPGVYISAPQVALDQFDLMGERTESAAATTTTPRSYVAGSGSANQEDKHLCIEFPIVVDRPEPDEENGGPCQSINLPSVQRPDLCDYKLSPHSFVSPVKVNLGGDCCESLIPSTVPVQEHFFYRVIVRAKENGGSDPVATSIERAVDITRKLEQPSAEVKFAEVLDYRQRWFAIGHALGEIKYSLPLAPGESTQLAVIEWSRTDAVSRFDSVSANENLTHWQNRDRTIEETINAGLKETQGGWSWAGGLSSGMAYDAKAYGQYTGNWAAGGGTSNSNGTRDLAAESQQELHDLINQSTSFTRSLNSTVIVQGSQAEANNVRTRRVANHNHCHALTIQYYEVLRHFKLETTFVGRRYAVLIPHATFEFDRANAIRFRYALEQALIDRSLLSYFDALVRLDLDRYETVPAATPEPKYFVGNLSGLNVNAADFPMFPMSNGKRLLIEKGSTLHITARAVGNVINFGGGSAGNSDVDGQPGRLAPANQNWPLPDAPSFAFLAKVGPKFYLVQRDGAFEAQDEGELSLWFNDAGPLTDNNGSATATVSVTAPAETETIDQDKVPVSSLSLKDADTMKEAFLLRHLNANRVYYNRAIWVLMDAGERRLYLEAALGSNSPILGAMDDKPIAVSGSHVGFIYEGPLPFTPWSEMVESSESIVTLPTRGLFAEAQLGHCNSCEKRDVTRMWDWTEMTVEEPPPITGIEPGPGGQTPAITPAQLPANVIQIAPTPAAPDPAGLAAALRLLGTPDIFRDMSGLDEASVILGKLVDGTTTTLTEMVRGAAAAKQKVDGARAQQNMGGAGQSSQQQTPAQRYDNLQVAKEVAQAADQLGLSEQQKSQLSEAILGGGGSGGGGGGGLLSQVFNATAGAVPGAPTVAVASDDDPGRRRCCALGQWKVGLRGALDPLAIGGHRKGGPLPGGTVGYVYSKRIGLVDLGHARDLADLTKFIYDGLVRGAVTFVLFEGTARVLRTPPDQESRLEIAGGIAFVDSWAHEIATWPDPSSFSPEDLSSNMVGIECAKRAIRVGGSFDAAMDTMLYALLNGELDAATLTETSSVLTKIDGDWFDITKPSILLRRNFDGVPWMAGMTFDTPGAPVIPGWLDPSAFAPMYSEFAYMMNKLIGGKMVMLPDLTTTTDGLRTAFVAANPGKDRP